MCLGHFLSLWHAASTADAVVSGSMSTIYFKLIIEDCFYFAIIVLLFGYETLIERFAA